MVPISIEWQRVLATTFARVRIAGHPSNSRISVAPVSRVQLDWWEEATEMFRRVLLVLHLWAALLASVSSCSWETGSFMVYEKEVDHVLNCRLVAVQPAGESLT